MIMATKTTNYNLTKPSGSENADIDVINANMDIIDSTLGNKANKSEIPDISNLATKSEIPDVSGFANKSDLTNLATKSEIPDVSGFATKTELSNGLSGKADKSQIPDVSGYATKTELSNGLSGKANTSTSNVFEGDQTIIGKTRLKFGGSDTPLSIQTTGSETGCYVELMNASGVTLGYYGALSSHRPVFYVNSNRELAFLDEIPKITISTSDPSGGSHGDIWLKYE